MTNDLRIIAEADKEKWHRYVKDNVEIYLVASTKIGEITIETKFGGIDHNLPALWVNPDLLILPFYTRVTGLVDASNTMEILESLGVLNWPEYSYYADEKYIDARIQTWENANAMHQDIIDFLIEDIL